MKKAKWESKFEGHCLFVFSFWVAINISVSYLTLPFRAWHKRQSLEMVLCLYIYTDAVTTYRWISIIDVKHICGYFSIFCYLIRKCQHCGMNERANRNGFDMSTYCKLDTFFMYALPRPDIVWHQDSIKIGSSCRKTLISIIILNHWLLLISLSQFFLSRSYRASFKPP